MERNTSINIPSIAAISARSYEIIRMCQTDEQKRQEDLNDKKAAWLSVVLEKGIDNLNERDKRFAKQYIEENIRYSLLYQFKPWLHQFIEEQRVKYNVKK